MLLLECPHCTRSFTIDRSKQAEIVPCVFCGEEMEVPANVPMSRTELSQHLEIIAPPIPSPRPAPPRIEPPPVIVNIQQPPAPRETPREQFASSLASTGGGLVAMLLFLGVVAAIGIAAVVALSSVVSERDRADQQVMASEEKEIIDRARKELVKRGIKGKLSKDTRVDLTPNRWGVSHTVSGSVLDRGLVRHFIVFFEITDFNETRVFKVKDVDVEEVN